VEIDTLENIPNFVEKLFIDKLKNVVLYEKEHIINVDKKLIEDLDIDIIGRIITTFSTKLKKTEDIFIIVSEKSNYDIKNQIKSKYVDDNEIYFGYKTDIDEPGIILITNENALKDKTNIRIGMFDIGFFPGKSYYKIQINE